MARMTKGRNGSTTSSKVSDINVESSSPHQVEAAAEAEPFGENQPARIKLLDLNPA